MTNANRSIGLMAGCVVLIGAAHVVAQDWPQWRGSDRDGKVAEFTAPETWPGALIEKWKTTVGSGDATPALVGDKLYVFARQGEDEVTLCLNTGDGKELWRDKFTAQAVTGAASRHPGPRSSPAVAAGKVVTLGVGGVLSCLDAMTGKLVWRKDPFPKIVPRFFTASSPIIADGVAVAQLGGDDNGAIIAYDLATGDEKWRWSQEGPEYASPMVLTVDGTKQIVTLTENSVVGVGLADGKLLWQLPFVPQRRAYNAATPIIDGQTVIYTGAGRGTNAVKIEKQGDGFVVEELWSNSELAPQYNTPVLIDGLLFGLSNRGKLFCINAKTGQTVWTDETSLDRKGFGAIVHAGSTLLALSSNSELVTFAPSDKQFTELARIKVADTSTYAHPVIAGNRIFVKDQDAVTMWTIK
jgi:outer membrane protein assembly factor BamB